MAYDKVVDSSVLDSGLTAIADAIRTKGGTTENLTFPDGMTSAIESIEAGGGDEESSLAALINRSITEISHDSVTKIGEHAFRGCSALTSADFPLVTIIGNNAFPACSALTTANFPQATSIGTYAFQSCSALTTADFPQATTIGGSAFYGCSALTSADFPLVTSILASAFRGCSALTTADFPQATTIGAGAFYNNYSFTALILRSETIAKLSNTNAFDGCYHFLGTTDSTYNPDGLQDGYIYVPAALVESYQSATNWSAYSTQFRALEDYTVDGTITGELDESKI